MLVLLSVRFLVFRRVVLLDVPRFVPLGSELLRFVLFRVVTALTSVCLVHKSRHFVFLLSKYPDEVRECVDDCENHPAHDPNDHADGEP